MSAVKRSLNMRGKSMQDALLMLNILAHPLRLSILCTIIESGEITAGDIVASEPQASQSQISQYLRTMRESGILTARRDGLFVYYRLKDKKAAAIMKVLKELYCQG